MPQTEPKFQVNQFTGGLVTDANPLADAGPISIDESNCEILSHGGRRRRRGAALEEAYSLHTTSVTNSQKEDWAFNTVDWKAVAGLAGLEFVVYQQGNRLWFYDKSFTPLSAGLKSFSVNLNTFRAPEASTTDVANTRVSVATGKGVLFVCGPTIEPFHVQYDPMSDSITATEITIEIRDFEEQDPSIGPQEEVTHPTTAGHLYDLLNQGWYQKGAYTRDHEDTNRSMTQAMLTKYQGHTDHNPNGYLPRKNTPWHVGKYVVAEDSGLSSHNFMSPQQIRSAPSGDTLAPFGHYILEAFRKDREAVVQEENAGDPILLNAYANLNNLEVEEEAERPVACAFYAGRVWYVLKNNVYFSQQLDQDSLEKAGKCYQEGDPTNEGESDIVATDGGLIPIPNMGRATGLAVMDTFLVITADNGLWSISGTSGSFTAVDFSVNRVSSVSVRSADSIVEAEGLVFFWGETGIYVLQPGEIRAVPELRDISEQRITEFYRSIPQSSKRNAKGIYEPESKTIYWMYKASADSSGPAINRYAYDRFLNFSLKFSAFYPWSVDATDGNQIVGGTVSAGLLSSLEEEAVVDSSDEDVLDSNGDIVSVLSETVVEASDVFKIMVLKDNAATFGAFDDITFHDWDEDDNGLNYSSYIETFYHIADDTMAFMQAPYVYTYFRRTEENPVTSVIRAPAYNEIAQGGMTWVGEYQSSYLRSTPNNIGYVNPEGSTLVAPDGTLIYVIEQDFSRFSFRDSTDGTELFGLTEAEIHPNLDNSYGDAYIILLNGTKYFIVKMERYFATSTWTAFAYYEINDDATGADFIGYIWQDNSDLLAQSQLNFNLKALGYLNSGQLTSPDSDEIKAQYPILLGMKEESHGSIAILPSVNDVASNTPIQMPNTADPWYDSQSLFGTDMDFDADSLLVTAVKAGSDANRGFFLPNSSASSTYFQMFYVADIAEHIAATASPTSTYISTHDSTYPSGFVSAVTISGTNFSVNAGSTIVGRHVTGIENFPFSDMSTNFDGSAGSSTLNYYGHPSCFPSNPDDLTSPWFMFWPKHYKGSSDLSKMGIRVTLWDPVSRTIKDIDYIQGEAWEQGVDIPNTYAQHDAGLYWDRATGDIYGLIRLTGTGLDGKLYSKLANFVPQIPSYTSTDPLVIGTESSTVIESSCILNTRWDWANAAVSGKVSGDIQLYRGGRVQFQVDPQNPTSIGLPVYVSKTKTRGRGRSLQLRFRSEEGKDFELYGWAVWAAKNTRF